jgi:hypothetical protein
VPAEGVVNALRTLHASLAPGGLVVDTQPVSARPPVEARSGDLGALDMRDWARTIAAVDDRLEETIRDRLFAVLDERHFVVADSFADGTEMLTSVRDWQGTRIPRALEQRVAREDGPVHVQQDIRMRLLRAL